MVGNPADGDADGRDFGCRCHALHDRGADQERRRAGRRRVDQSATPLTAALVLRTACPAATLPSDEQRHCHCAGEGLLLPTLKREFGGVVIANDGFDQNAAEAVLRQGQADAVAFGHAFIANPDLVERLCRRAALNDVDPSIVYDSFGARGYTDYPTVAAG